MLAELDREVQQLDRLASLGTLVAEIAHEVRNPLVSIKTFVQLLPERWEDPEFSERFLALVTEELRRMERLLDVVIEHARPVPDSSDLAGASVDDALDSALVLLRHRAYKQGVAIERESPRDLPRVTLDSDSLRQVVLNLALNAIEASPAGGRVGLRAQQQGESVWLRISDQGPGIAPELREEIFTAFFSTRAERSGGLGLAITRRIVSEAGGSVVAREAPGGGAEFVVQIPIVVV
jgi:signal transduction histidine kinase